MNVVGSPFQDERGGLQLSAVLAIVLGLGLAASAYLNIYQAQRSAGERKLMLGEITDLRYQVKKDQQATKTTSDSSADANPVATPEATPTPSPAAAAATPEPQVAGASAQTKTVNTAATLRAGPSASARAVVATKIPAGTVVNVTGGTSGSYTPVTVNGAAGYLLTSALN
jgi:hypothetical protein